MTPDFNTTLAAFVAKVQAHISGVQHAGDYGTVLTIERGNRYMKIVAAHGMRGTDGQRSVWGFVDKTNGDILKAATWRAPAKNFARGNIYRDDNKPFSWTGVS